MLTKTKYILFVFFVGSTIMAQEFLKPLKSNLNYLYSEFLPPSINNFTQCQTYALVFEKSFAIILYASIFIIYFNI